MHHLRLASLLAAALGAGALFGFYFTLSVSIMPGLDQAGPFVAIAANQSIGRATQSSVFFIALLGTPLALLLALALHWRRRSTQALLVGAIVGWIGMLVVTLTLNVPLNQTIDALEVVADQSNLAELWAAYSIDWQYWNWLRVIASGASLLFVCAAIREPVSG